MEKKVPPGITSWQLFRSALSQAGVKASAAEAGEAWQRYKAESSGEEVKKSSRGRKKSASPPSKRSEEKKPARYQPKAKKHVQSNVESSHVSSGNMPFDLRFIQAMIPHHERAIAMARDALEEGEHQEIRDFARAIISAQRAEIVQMKQWLRRWYGISQ